MSLTYVATVYRPDDDPMVNARIGYQPTGVVQLTIMPPGRELRPGPNRQVVLVRTEADLFPEDTA